MVTGLSHGPNDSVVSRVDARVNSAVVVSWELMSSTVRLTVAAAACSALLAIAASSASAAPGTDDQGHVDSTARCTAPSTAVFFGSTETSRIAICKASGGQYEYRGVRVRDGAKLIVSASQSGDGYVADNDGVTYTVSAKSLVVSVGSKVIREEPMVDSHASGTPAPPTATTPATPLPPPMPAEVGGGR
jgi:hypothetical protein